MRYDVETGWYYLQSRYYNPEWGRFLNSDVFINANGDIIGFNMYAYCSNNPIKFIDRTGYNAVGEYPESVYVLNHKELRDIINQLNMHETKLKNQINPLKWVSKIIGFFDTPIAFIYEWIFGDFIFSFVEPAEDNVKRISDKMYNEYCLYDGREDIYYVLKLLHGYQAWEIEFSVYLKSPNGDICISSFADDFDDQSAYSSFISSADLCTNGRYELYQRSYTYTYCK